MRLQTFLALVAVLLTLPPFLQADSNDDSNQDNVLGTPPPPTHYDNGVTLIKGRNFSVSVDSTAVAMSLLEGKNPLPFSELQMGEMIKPQYQKSEMQVDKLEGTIMVQHVGDAKPSALQTFSTVGKGDILTVYDKSWLILKDHRGDRIGLDGRTVVSIDEFFIAGPDRQVRLLLQRGTLYLKTNNSSSKQSFFEVNAGQVVASVGDVQAVLSYDPDDKEHLNVQYLGGRINVIDRDKEEKFQLTESYYDRDAKLMKEKGIPNPHQVHNWENGVEVEDTEKPVAMEEIDVENFHRFFEGQRLFLPVDNNMLLDENGQVAKRYR